MKKTTFIGATLAFLGLAIAPLSAQTQSTTTASTTGYVQSSTVIGSKIKDSRGQDVGEIKDVVLDRNSGCLAYVVLSTRGTGTSTAVKTVAAPWSVFSASSDSRVYITRVERERIYSAPVWESTRIEEYSRPEYINSVYGYYGVTVPNFSIGVTSTSGTTTGATTTSSTSASTTASATPAATAAATSTPAASATAAATMTPAASATAKASPTVQGTPVASPASKPATSPTAPASTKSPAESATKTSPSEKAASSPKTSSTSTSEKKSTDTATEKSDKGSTKTESSSDKSKKSSEEASPKPTPYR